MAKNDLEDRIENGKFGDPSKDISNYVKGEVVGELGAIAGSYVGAKVGEEVFKGSSRLLNILSGSIPGDYLLGSLFSGGYFYNKYKEEYKGWKGKKKFLKDQLNFHIREAPATVASYLAYAPITAAGLALGLAAGPAAVLGSILSSALYIGGSYLLNRNYLKKMGRKQNEKQASPAPQSPQPSYMPPQGEYQRAA